MPDMRACTTRATKPTEKVMCARVTESMPRLMFRPMKKITSETPIRSSGMAIGVSTSRGSTRSLKRCRATPARVPSRVATLAETSAMTSELAAAWSMSRLPNSLRYQSRVKPTHSAFSRESLKEYSTTITSGT
ncbi:Uncharacterised protein [Pseudomonas aeruginosa]|nr:Uncharacterised protein [Pseudomonas aeruginosa]